MGYGRTIFTKKKSHGTDNDGDKECRHFIGIIDRDEKYVIAHLFQSETECFGFVIFIYNDLTSKDLSEMLVTFIEKVKSSFAKE